MIELAALVAVMWSVVLLTYALSKLFRRRLPKFLVPCAIVPALGVGLLWLAGRFDLVDLPVYAGLPLGATALWVRECMSQLARAGRAMSRGEKVPRMFDDEFGENIQLDPSIR